MNKNLSRNRYRLFSIALIILILNIVVLQRPTQIVDAGVLGAQSAAFYQQDFEAFGDNTDPTNWLDTAANNSMAVNDALFKVSNFENNNTLATISTVANIHSHYAESGSELWSNYSYSGRMMVNHAAAGIGVTFFSDYNQTDAYYRLRRYDNGGAFHLSPHGTNMTGGVTNSGVVPAINTWYHFKIEVEDAGGQTNIRAKVWQDGTTEPAAWQIDAYDSSASRLTAGTFGVWSYNNGRKYWDDFVVQPLTPPGPHTLTLNSSGSGSVTADPDDTEFTHGTEVALSATADSGWVFLEWSGDLSGSDNPATITMDGNKSVTAVFVEDIPQSVTTAVVGSGVITVNPDQPQYSIGDVVTVTAVPDSEWFFSGWSGDLTGTTNPAVLVIDSSKTVTATFTQELPGVVNEDFNGYAAGNNPANWQDTAANNSMAVNDSLFTVNDVNGEMAFGTTSTLNNIHSHYQDENSANLTNYNFTGRMMHTTNIGGIGVTFLSDYNQSDTYYRLRRYGMGGTFHLSPHGTNITGGTTDSGVAPAANTWYRFRIEVEDTGSQTDIRAKIWQDGTTEPAGWQIEAYDSSSSRLTAGTVGVWSMNNGNKYWDDFKVEYLNPGPFTLTLNNNGSGSVTADPDQPFYDFGDGVTLTAVPDTGWQFDGWAGNLSGSDNPAVVTMNGNKAVTAEFSPIPTYTVATNVIGNGVIVLDPNQASYEAGTVVTVTAVPDAGWRFEQFGGDLTGITNPATLLVDGNKSITAAFAEDLPITLTVNTVGNGTTTTMPDQPAYNFGETVVITATAANGWRFDNWQSNPLIAAGWWDTDWSFRLPVTVGAADFARTNTPAEVAVNFTTVLAGLGENGDLDLNSLRVVEVDGNNNIVDAAVPFQFDTAATFDAGTNAAGTAVILLTGNTSPETERTYHIYFDVTGKSFDPPNVPPLVTLTDNIMDAGLDTYRIETGQATFYYDKDGGGFSSIVDANGNDWLNYNSTPGSAGTYRGVPNMVYPEGHMHPGNGGVVSAIINQGPLKSTIFSASQDGNWETMWEIYPEFARMTVLKASHNYWFLYEGTPGGVLELNSDFVVRSNGTQTLAGVAWTGDLAGEEWAYFGDPVVGRSLYVVSHQQDTAIDSYYAMEGNMTVFGFGRQGTNTYLNAVPGLFTLGLVDDTAYGAVAGTISAAYQPLNVVVGSVEAKEDFSTNSNEQLSFNITTNQVVTATFTELFSPTLTVAAVGNGTVVVEPDLPQYIYGQTVTVTAVADSEWHFSDWSGDISGSSSPLVFAITDHMTLTANFAENVPLTLSVGTVGDGAVELSPDQPTYSYGQVVTLTAVADTNWSFDDWSGAATGTNNPVTIVMNGDKAVTANFFLSNPSATLFDIWYGDVQQYGHMGLPQPWFNILGNVSDLDGVATLRYSLNGGAPVNLSIGTDDRRLANDGDFNVDLRYQDLIVGNNEVLITAVDNLGNQATKTVTIVYESGNVWPASYTVDWSSAATLEDVAQVVDGEWGLAGDGVRVLEPDYDRLLAIGDVNWSDYEVTVPITIHAIDPEGFQSGTSGGAGLGMLFRWNGHTDFPVSSWQPKTGWLPYGAIGWYWWDSLSVAHLRLSGNNNTILAQGTDSTPPTVGGEYIFKMRVETIPNVGGFYQFKVWPANESEPTTWNLSGQEAMSDPQNGSVLLLAHHIDATFGDVVVTPLGFLPTTLDVTTNGNGSVTVDPDKTEYNHGESVTLTATPESGWTFTGWQGDLTGNQNPAVINMTTSMQITATFVADTTPPTISNIDVAAYSNSAVVTWQTDKPASSEVHYGETNGYELGSVSDSTLRTNHTITLTGLISQTTYHYQIVSVDASDNEAASADATFATTDGSQPGSVVSDDFNACTLNGGLWNFVNPVGDGSVAVNGTQVALAVPGGISHDVWTGGNYAPRLMQTVNDIDFEVEVKYESLVSATYQMQGIIVEQDGGNYLRFDFYGNNGQVYLFAARFTNGTPTVVANVPISVPGQSMYMRITRTGNSWIQSYSFNGTDWTTNANFAHALAVSQVGVFAGNVGANPPAHTAVIDYFFNTAAPIIPEDANSSSLSVNVVGNGSVSGNPDQGVFACGETVELTAVPDTGWLFDSWSGDLTGSDNPASVLMDSDKTITATFVFNDVDVTPPVISNVQLAAGEQSAVITWQTDEPASSEVHYGETSGYELGSVSDSTLRTNHTITLTGLISQTTYHYQIVSVDASDNEAASADATFATTDGSQPGSVVSDDFNACTLNGGLWNFVNPVGDGSVAVNGTQVALAVPGGISHDVWTGGNYAPRLMQTVNDIDFEVEVKYESLVSAAYQMQGIIVEQDGGNYLRFDFYGNNGQVYLFAARFTNGSPTVIANVPISVPGQAMYMRIGRVGNNWTQSYSFNGIDWTTSAAFAQALAVGQVGVFAGNAGTSPPAHTAVIDYFFNTAAPIIPEDNIVLQC